MLNDATSTLLQQAMTIRSARHSRLADAVANVDTPGYRPEDVDFAATLEAAGRAAVKDDDIVTVRGAESDPTPDGNTVDLDRTMAALAENGTQYAATARFSQKRLSLMRYVASDGMA